MAQEVGGIDFLRHRRIPSPVDPDPPESVRSDYVTASAGFVTDSGARSLPRAR